MNSQPKDSSQQESHNKNNQTNPQNKGGAHPRQMQRGMARNMGRNMGGGRSHPLDAMVQAKMERSFQQDFSDVKVTENSAEAQNMGALAFTQGQDVHFAPGQYNPNSSAGQELIGHELTHVVQQKQGRVKATQQAKGVAVNDDPALEQEADVMGRKAASGQEALVQKKSEEGVVQKQGDPKKEDIVYTEGFSEKKISNVNVKGEYYNVIRGRDGKYYKRNVAKIITTSKSKWKEILKNANSSYYMYHQWVFGFLKANSKGLRSFSFVPNQQVLSAPNSGPLYCTLYDDSPISDNEKLAFLEALYGVDEKSNQVNLPNGYNTEAGISAEKTFFPMMADFVEANQPLLIRSISSRETNSRMDKISGNITHLADEATPQGVFSVGKPEVSIAMIQSAYGSALSAAKSLINLSLEGVNKNSFDQAINESEVIYNSGLIINNNGSFEKISNGSKALINIEQLPYFLL